MDPQLSSGEPLSVQAQPETSPPIDPSALQTNAVTLAASDPRPGAMVSSLRALGPYLLKEELGHGGMGIVYRAQDRNLGREVALKMIRGGFGAEEITRFFREAKAVAQLKHRHIIKIHEFGQIDGLHYFTMELAEHGSLAKNLKQFSGDVRAAVVLVEKVARAVHYVHECNLLHRDLKPANILLEPNDEPIVSDFGLAKQLAPTDVALTATGEVPGTPAYMAPEQVSGSRAVSRATDTWALGVILFELVCGQRPFTGPTRDKVTEAIVKSDPPDPRALQPTVDRSLEAVILKALKKDHRERYATAGEFADELGRWLRGEPTVARPMSWPRRVVRRHRKTISAVVGLVLLTTIAVAAYRFVPDRRTEVDPDIVLTRDILPALERKERVVLLSETDGPAWSRWIVRGTDLAAKDGAFGFHAVGVSLLELLPNVPLERYRFSAEVRHERSPTGKVGIYACRSTHALSWGEVHGYCAVSYADQGNKAKEFGAVARMDLGHYSSPKHIDHTHHIVPGKEIDAPEAGKPAEWRRIAMDVTPERISWYWNGALVASEDKTSRLRHARTLVLNRPVMEGVKPEFPHDGGLGLFVKDSSASFRNVIIEPLVE